MPVTRSLLILGGSGWLGPLVVDAAVGAGLDVTVLNRGTSGVSPAGATAVVGDRTSAEGYAGVTDRTWDFVLDTTWQPGQARSALEALGHRAGWWCFVSSTGIYLDAASDPDESSPTTTAFEGDVAGDREYTGAKVAIERAATDALGERLLIARSGLLSGPGDISDRFGYWVSRFALAGDGPVLVPATPDQTVQTMDARDLAAWLVDSMLQRRTGAYNAVGPTYSFSKIISAAHDATGGVAEIVTAEPAWLRDHGVRPWLGERSLPLWFPPGVPRALIRSDDTKIRATTPHYGSLAHLTAATLDDERSRGLERPRRAGLTRLDELALIDELRVDRAG